MTRVLFLTSNGVGMGHVTRMLAVAKHCDAGITPVFVTMSQAMKVIKKHGFLAEFIPFQDYLQCDERSWNNFLRRELNEIFTQYSPSIAIFDGNNPYDGLIGALEDNPECFAFWCRRAMWPDQAGIEDSIKREYAFHTVIEPGELAASYDHGITTRYRSKTRLVAPIRLLDDKDLLSRRDACEALSLDPSKRAMLLQFGAGNNFDFQNIRSAVLDRLLKEKGLQVVFADWLITNEEIPLPPDVRRVQVYPIGKYLRAFDFAISAAGYNSFHELLAAGLPTIFIPNEHPRTDLQANRAEYAERTGLGLYIRTSEVDKVRPCLDLMLDPGFREEIRGRCLELPRVNGAQQAAALVAEVVHERSLIARSGKRDTKPVSSLAVAHLLNSQQLLTALRKADLEREFLIQDLSRTREEVAAIRKKSSGHYKNLQRSRTRVKELEALLSNKDEVIRRFLKRFLKEDQNGLSLTALHSRLTFSQDIITAVKALTLENSSLSSNGIHATPTISSQSSDSHHQRPSTFPLLLKKRDEGSPKKQGILHRSLRSAVRSILPADVTSDDIPGKPKRSLLEDTSIAPNKVSNFVVASVLDEFSFECFAPDCALLNIHPENFEEELAEIRPHILLVESAWHGKGGAWRYKIGRYSQSPKDGPLCKLIEHCRSRDIPTIFWNKEDPVHFERFRDSASLFDYVFTTDQNMVDCYIDKLGLARDRVAALPFAAQPKIHNPIETRLTRLDEACFAGSYYANRHDARRLQLDRMLDGAIRNGVVIYDRNHGSDDLFHSFPMRFRPFIRGKVPYPRLSQIYKEHKCFLNVNSVTDSPTMFARRVFELLASGTVVVSSESLGVENYFSGIVQFVRESSDVHKILEIVNSDESYRRKISRSGVHRVMSNHTYAHRLATIAQTAGFTVDSPRLPSYSALAFVQSESGCREVLTMIASQTEAPVEVIACVPEDGPADLTAISNLLHNFRESSNIQAILVSDRDRCFQVSEAPETAWLAMFFPRSHYPQTYVEELLIATRYASGDVIGAPSTPSIGEPLENRYSPQIDTRYCLVRTSVLRTHGWNRTPKVSASQLKAWVSEGISCYAAYTPQPLTELRR